MARPTVGNKVVASGRCGEVLLDDPTDMDMTYKVGFADGSADWFKQADVSLDDSGAALAADGCEAEGKARAAAEHLEKLKAAQARQAEEQNARIEASKQRGGDGQWDMAHGA
mmetsp:Transcript_119271/g.210707  ORF Transcript_119271/g.210707 Transcript_119271/m.210707 type:complete len:112 (+) Transcript_119271:84-419(+)